MTRREVGQLTYEINVQQYTCARRRHGAGIHAAAVQFRCRRGCAFELAARDRGVPLNEKVVNVERPTAANFYNGLVLSRPDQHVAWRGDKLPADPLALIDHIRGASN